MDYDDVRWGDQLCELDRCMRPAEVLLNGVPTTIECADRAIERLEAVSVYPRMRELLPGLVE